MGDNQLTEACIELLEKGAYDALKKTLTDFRRDKVKHAKDYAAWETTMREVLIHAIKLEADKKAPNGDSEALTKFYNEHLDAIIRDRQEKPSKVIRERLFIGEADFSFTAAFIRKVRETVPDIGKHIRATEYLPAEALEMIYGNNVLANVTYAREAGAKFRGNVDARALSTYSYLKDRYHRIHFNFPNDRSDYMDPDRPLPKMIAEFFQEASKKQQLFDRVHIAIPKENRETKDMFRQAHIYDLYDAAAKAGYMPIKKRQFGSHRYPGYAHCVSAMNASATVAQNSREYIFEKTNYSYDTIMEMAPPRRHFASQLNKIRKALPEMQTDDDSSDYMTDNECEELKLSKPRPSLH